MHWRQPLKKMLAMSPALEEVDSLSTVRVGNAHPTTATFYRISSFETMLSLDSLDEVEWINDYLKSANIVPSMEELQSIFYFSFVWNLFEGKVCDEFCDCPKLEKVVDDLAAKNKLVLIDFQPHFEYFRSRYVQGNSTNSLFKKLCFRAKEEWAEDIVDEVLRGIREDVSDVVKALAFIAYRFRNNWFHGIKRLEKIDNHTDSFKHLNHILIKLIELKGKY